MTRFDVGDIATLDFTVSVANVLTDPTTITLTITLPDGTTLTPAPTHSSTGTYTYDYLITQTGQHAYRWLSTGAAQSAESGTFYAAAPTTVHTDVGPDDVADLLAQRVLTKDGNAAGTFDATTIPTADQVQRLINKVAAEETGGLGTIPVVLTDQLHSLVSLSAAVRVLGVYFSGDAARDDLDADLKDLRERFRAAVDVIVDTGDPNAVSAEPTSGGSGGKGGEERPPYPRGSFPSVRHDALISPLPLTNLYERY